ncbi:MAG TPA: hypothetical protein VJX92_12685 [Methylomirabilota bacterium]|nr:hypothetical protein [Methylomirabilota bacterium]
MGKLTSGQALDRLPLGEGSVPFKEFFGAFARKGYAGFASYEAPNPTAWETQSQCETRRAIGLMAQSMHKAIQASLGPCEAMTIAPGGTLYWGIGVPDAGGFILFRNEKSCHWFREGWTEVPTWKKTVCVPVGLQRGKPASS